MFTMLANLSYNDDVCGYYNVWTPVALHIHNMQTCRKVQMVI